LRHELAFVNYAAQNGFKLVERGLTTIGVEVSPPQSQSQNQNAPIPERTETPQTGEKTIFGGIISIFTIIVSLGCIGYFTYRLFNKDDSSNRNNKKEVSNIHILTQKEITDLYRGSLTHAEEQLKKERECNLTIKEKSKEEKDPVGEMVSTQATNSNYIEPDPENREKVVEVN